MKKVFILACSILAMLSSCALFGQGAQTEPLVQELMLKSGLDRQLEQYPATIQAGVENGRRNFQLRNFTDEDFNELSGFIRIAYDPRNLKRGVRSALASKMSGTDIQSALLWLDSQLGEKITKLEAEASTPEGFAASRSMGEQLAGDPARVELVGQLVRAVKGTESAMESMRYTRMVLLASLYSAYYPEHGPSAEEIEAMAIRSTEEIRPKLEPVVLNYFLYAYRSLSDAEIGQYIAFSESDAGRKYIEAGNAALNETMLQASRELGGLVGKMFLGRHSRKEDGR